MRLHKFIYLFLLAIVNPAMSAASETLIYQCKSKNLAASIKIQFADSSWRTDQKAETPYVTASTFLFGKDRSKKINLKSVSKVDFYQKDHNVLGTQWWDYQYDRKIIRVGGRDLDFDGFRSGFILEISAKKTTGKLSWGHRDHRGGPKNVCIYGQCFKWTAREYDSNCTLQEVI